MSPSPIQLSQVRRDSRCRIVPLQCFGVRLKTLTRSGGGTGGPELAKRRTPVRDEPVDELLAHGLGKAVAEGGIDKMFRFPSRAR